MTRWLTVRLEDAVLIVVSGAGLGLFVAPLVLGARFPQAVALFSGLVAVCALVVLGVALQTHHLSTRLLAILAGLVAVDATLRLVIVVGVLGFSPIFFLIIAGGFVMGPSFGFASGAMTLLLSAVLTAAGLAYGLLLDLWEWPLLLAPASSPLSWVPGLGISELVRRFGGFYLSTSLVYDAFRAAGNAILIALLGPAVITALDRFRRRFLVNWMVSGPSLEQATGKISRDVGTPA